MEPTVVPTCMQISIPGPRNLTQEPEIQPKNLKSNHGIRTQAQDFEKLMQREEVDIDIHVHGDGLVKALWEDGLKDKNKQLSYKELFDDIP